MRYNRPSTSSSLLAVSVRNALLLCCICCANAFGPYSHDTLLMPRPAILQRDTFFRYSIKDTALEYPGERSTSRLWASSPTDDKDEETDDNDGADQDWFKLGKQLAQNLKETTDLKEDELTDVATKNIEEVSEEPPNSLLKRAQEISLEAARALVANAAAFCELKETDLVTVQADIQNLQEKLTALQDQESSLKEEVTMAQSYQEQSVEQERAVVDAFQRIEVQNKDNA